jgi:hypothetical protein
MQNLWMASALLSGDAVDINTLGDRQPDGTWVLRVLPPDGPDLVDAVHERFIGSVGRQLGGTALIMAATDSRFYGAEGWECLWLR